MSDGAVLTLAALLTVAGGVLAVRIVNPDRLKIRDPRRQLATANGAKITKGELCRRYRDQLSAAEDNAEVYGQEAAKLEREIDNRCQSVSTEFDGWFDWLLTGHNAQSLAQCGAWARNEGAYTVDNNLFKSAQYSRLTAIKSQLASAQRNHTEAVRDVEQLRAKLDDLNTSGVFC